MNQSSKGAFISYSHADKEFVDRLVADLRRCDVNLWVDKRELKVGDSLMRRIRKGIDSADYFLVIISEHSVKSEWVQRELDMAMNDEILTGRIKVLPLVLADTDLPGFLKGKVYADFSKNYQIALQEVLAAIGVQDSDMAVKLQNHPSMTEDTGADGGYRNRDIHVLTELVSTFNTHAIDDFIDRGPTNGIIPNVILDHYTLFRAFVEASDFQIFDEQFKPVLNTFIDAWDACMGYDEFFFPSDIHPFVKMQAPHEVDDPDRLIAARENFIDDVTQFADAYKSFMDYVHSHYPEIDLRVTNQKAFEAIDSKGNSQEQEESSNSKPGEGIFSKAQFRQRIHNITCGQWLTLVGIVIAFIVLLFGNNIYQQITGHSLFQNPTSASPTPTSIVNHTPTSTPAVTSTSTLSPTTFITPTISSIPKRVPCIVWDEWTASWGGTQRIPGTECYDFSNRGFTAAISSFPSNGTAFSLIVSHTEGDDAVRSLTHPLSEIETINVSVKLLGKPSVILRNEEQDDADIVIGIGDPSISGGGYFLVFRRTEDAKNNILICLANSYNSPCNEIPYRTSFDNEHIHFSERLYTQYIGDEVVIEGIVFEVDGNSVKIFDNNVPIKEFDLVMISDNSELLEEVKRQLWVGWHFTKGGDGSIAAEIQMNEDLLSVFID